MTTPAPFTWNGVAYHPLPSQGAYFGVEHDVAMRAYLVCVAMNADGSPELYGEEPNWIEVSNFDDRQDLLDEVNTLLGTTFHMSAFPGR